MSQKVRYIDAPEGAQEDMQAAGSAGNSIADAGLIPTGAPDTPWATLEPGVWALDGSRELLPEAPAPGWWSLERTDEEGVFAARPVITLSFSAPYTATGLTFTFSPSTDQWCSQIHVSWYNGETLIAEGDYYPDSAKWVLAQLVESFDRIQIELIATNVPGQFAKLQKIDVGHVVIFENRELAGVQLVNEVDPSLCELTVDTMTVEIINRTGRDLAPQSNQKMELYRGDSLQAVQYIVTGSREDRNRYVFSCQSAIGLLQDTFLGGLYNNTALEALLAEVLGEWLFALDEQFVGMTVSGYLPVCTQREALQQIAFAIGAVIKTQEDGVIHFVPVPSAVTGTFDSSRIFSGAKLETSARIARVEVAAHSYTQSAETETLLQEEEIDGEGVLITFDDPHHSYAVSGGTLVDSGVNWVKVTASGPVTLTAGTYVHSAVLHTKRNPRATAKEQGNIITVSDATLLHSGIVKTALERLYAASQLRQTLKQEAVITGQRAGDYVTSENPWGTYTEGVITSMESTLTQNGHTAALTICGVETAAEEVL